MGFLSDLRSESAFFEVVLVQLVFLQTSVDAESSTGNNCRSIKLMFVKLEKLFYGPDMVDYEVYITFSVLFNIFLW